MQRCVNSRTECSANDVDPPMQEPLGLGGGYWLPAGRVDDGEGIVAAGVRVTFPPFLNQKLFQMISIHPPIPSLFIRPAKLLKRLGCMYVHAAWHIPSAHFCHILTRRSCAPHVSAQRANVCEAQWR
jgi:hypothetical protein